MRADGLAGEVLNLGSEDEIAVQTLAETILDVYDPDSKITHGPLPEDDPQRRCPDLSKAESLLSYELAVDLDKRLDQRIDYFESELA